MWYNEDGNPRSRPFHTLHYPSIPLGVVRRGVAVIAANTQPRLGESLSDDSMLPRIS
jgi:hypothetical protein